MARLPSPRLAWRSRELVADEHRTQLARSVADTVQAADERFLPGASPLDCGAVRETRSQLLELASRLFDLDRPVMPRGILLTERLLTGPRSPLYARTSNGALRDEVVRTLRALEREGVH